MNGMLTKLMSKSKAQIIIYVFCFYLNNNFIESFNKTFKAWYKTKKGFKNFESAVALITTFIYYYNFLHEHSSLNNLTPAMVAGLNYSTKDIKNWMLF